MGLQAGAGIQNTPAHHTDLLIYLAKRIKAKSYLEIGVQNRFKNLERMGITDSIGVDPDRNSQADCIMTSDRFFEINKKKFDLIFIDGMHEKEQVERDFNNSVCCLNRGGLIVMHDTAPEAEYLTHVPRDKKGRWLGDVYKFICHLNSINGIDFRTMDFDNGCTVAWIDEEAKGFEVPEITWDYYLQNKDGLLRIVDFAQLENILFKIK
jgi:hypothetical protein